MKITPIEIEQQQFGRAMWGWSPDEVRRFLADVARDLEGLTRENTRLKEELQRRDQSLTELRANEGQLRDTLTAAGRLSDEIAESARKEAEVIRAEAEVRAEQIVAAGRNEVVRLSEETRTLKLQRARMIADIRSIIDGHQRLIDTHREFDQENRTPRFSAKTRPVLRGKVR
jgi:cell division initiation protein